MAFIIPGAVSIILGTSYLAYTRRNLVRTALTTENNKNQNWFCTRLAEGIVISSISYCSRRFCVWRYDISLPRLFDVRMQGITTDIAVTGTLAATIYVVAAFAQLVVGRQIDKRSIKNVLIFVACGQPLFLFLMQLYTDYNLFAVSLLAMSFVFGQIPINRCCFAAICSLISGGRRSFR